MNKQERGPAISVYMGTELHRQLKEAVAREGTSMAAVGREQLTYWLAALKDDGEKQKEKTTGAVDGVVLSKAEVKQLQTILKRLSDRFAAA